MNLTAYRTLGRSGLAVSPMALGTMTFGADRWGSGAAGSRAVFDAYVEAGGNFVDTADVYSSGSSESMLGEFIAERGLRDRIVIATKAGFAREKGHPHAGGNGAKNIHAALNGSLKRLRTDYVDLFFVHVWDMVTPAEEVLGTLADLVRAGKIRYFGLSNVPAWYLAKMTTLAGAHAMPVPVALQAMYSLIDRGIENEFVQAANEFGIGIMPWSPLGGGFLTGKYTREDAAKAATGGSELPTGTAEGETVSDGRLSGANPFGDTLFTERNWAILDALRTVAADVGRSPAQVALAWTIGRPGVTSLLLGASRPQQLAENIAALEIDLSATHRQALDTASAMEPVYPYPIFSPTVNRMVFGWAQVSGMRR